MKEKLHHIHIALLIYMIQSGVVLFTLPRTIAENFGTNGWLFLVILSGVAALNIFLILIVYRSSRGRSIFQILEESISRVLLYPVYLFLVAVWALIAVVVAKQFMILVVMIAFPTMSAQMLLMSILFLAWLLISKGIYNMLKAVTFFFFMTIWTLLIVLFHIPEMDLARLTPFIFKGETNFLLGGIAVYGAFLGYELTLLLFPYVGKETKLFKAVFAGHLFTTVVYLIVTIVAYAFFGYKQLLELLYPTITLMKYIETPMIERLDNLIFSAFVLKTLVTVTFYFWAAVQVTGRILPKLKDEAIAFFIILVSYFIAYIPVRNREIELWLDILAKLVWGIALGLPLCLLVVIWLQKDRRRLNEKSFN